MKRHWSNGLRSGLLLAVACFLALSLPAPAAETISPRNLVSVPIEIRNAGAAPILCQAEIAHWFATDLAAINPGESADLGLHFDIATGAWAAMNGKGEALPVERAWCGVRGRTFETRFDLTLVRDRPAARVLTCTTSGERLHCR
jgi:hypothetical protein